MEEALLSSASIAEQEGGRGGLTSSSSSSLLHRRKKKIHRRLSYTSSRVVNGNDEEKTSMGRRTELGPTQESVFLNMHTRKMHRRVNGHYNNDSLCCEFVFVAAVSLLMFGVGLHDSSQMKGDKDDDLIVKAVIDLLIWAVIVLAVFFIVGRRSPYAQMLRWMLIWIPLLYWSALFVFWTELHDENYGMAAIDLTHTIMLAFYISLEVLTFCGFTVYYKCAPRVMHSDWIRKEPGRIRKFWSIRAAPLADDPWTMCYRGHNPTRGSLKCLLDYTCKYEGDIDESSGLPDGLGRWIDDAWEGEMLTGYWKQGEPVAPFSSWNVGNDDAVVAVRVAYFKATDDAFSKNKFFPTNDQNPPECGVASVECSVSGSFYKHLPRTTLIEGPYVADAMPTAQNNPVRETLSHLFQLSEEDECAVHISTADSRGVQVLGHVYEPTGQYYSSNAKTIAVDVEWGSSEEGNDADTTDKLGQFRGRRQSNRFLQKSLFMPKPTTEPLSQMVEVEVEDSSDEESSHVDNENGGVEVSGTNFDLQEHSASQMRQSSQEPKTATLRVQNWVPCRFKEALIFCPGYNACMEFSLSSMGQFLAMTKLSLHVYPIVFVWPGSVNLGYPYASKISATDINQQNMLKLVRGLKEAGIRRFHFLSHSMGVQTLMGAFCDKYDANGVMTGRSDVSKEFTLAPDFDTTEGDREGKRQRFNNRMTCRSITLMNPDFPVKAFVDRGFETIRRVCSTITVVGDKNDRALWWSSLMNGVAPRFGYEQPQVMWPTIAIGPSNKPRSLVKRIGRSVEDLYFPPHLAGEHLDKGNGEALRRLLFNKAPLRGQLNAYNTAHRFWLDMDVIDMTGLDTNIKGMRHNGFSLNGMLLKDLQELFSTGKRAITRSTLLHREGNQFSFVRAPAFVSV